MTAQDIISFHEEHEDFSKAISYQAIYPHLEELRAYYRVEFPSGRPMFMATMVANAVQYGQIICGDAIYEAIEAYTQAEGITDPEEQERTRELITYQTFKL